MRWLSSFLVGLAILLLAAGCEWRPLPFPTPAQHDLVVLIGNGPLTYAAEDGGSAAGLEHDLIEAFAQELGVGVRYLEASADDIQSRLDKGQAHFAAAWFSPEHGSQQQASAPFLHSLDILVQHEASLPIDEVAELKGRRVHVMAGSRQAAALQALRTEIPELEVVEFKDGTVFDLLEDVGEQQADIALVDSAQFELAKQFVPSIQATLGIGDDRPIAWRFGEKGNAELLARANAFIQRARKDGTLDRLQDRYLGHVRRLKAADVIKFIAMTETTLPKLRRFFQAAQVESGLDWRLVAAVAYHESQWDPNATSPTGVRGIMMLTEDTADHLGVSNRLDARESILAGARYISSLKEQQPSSTPEPDRTWLALAAYNIGPGHFNAARTLARQLKANSDSWYEMKRILPLLAQPKYYERLKSGRARGGEAVILAENIRSYYDILVRHEMPFRPALTLSGKAPEKAGRAPGLKTAKIRR